MKMKLKNGELNPNQMMPHSSDLMEAASVASSLVRELIVGAQFARGELNPDDPDWYSVHLSMMIVTKQRLDKLWADMEIG